MKRANGDDRTWKRPGPDGLSARATRTLKAVPRIWNRFWRLVSLYMPKRLYARSLIIVIAPMILLQSVVAFVFMERHWATVTQRLSQATVRDIAAIIDLIETYPHDADYANIIRIAQDRMQLKVDLLPPDPLPPPGPKPFFSILDDVLSSEITRQINRPFWIDTVGNSNIVEVRVQLENKVLRVFVRRSQAYASNTHIFLIWMVGTSLVLLMIAIPFLRNQIRPILTLAEAAESFGKGRPMPRDFRPRGAEEVRRAGFAFIQMRERIERQIDQRTAMLTGVSHDLRTILTRFKLQLALAGGKAETKAALNQDIDDMQSMLEGYLSFARGEASEDPGRFDLEAYFQKLSDEAALRKCKLSTTLSGDPTVHVGQTPSRGCCPTSSATPSAMPRRWRSAPITAVARLWSPSTTTAPAFPSTGVRMCSSPSCGSTRPATSTPAAPGSACRSPATSPAAMAATSPSTTARSAACAR